jgi:hypothetical protein
MANLNETKKLNGRRADAAYLTECCLSASDNIDAPIRVRCMSRRPNEDGVRSGFHQDFTVEEARELAKSLQQAAVWVESGAWRVR